MPEAVFLEVDDEAISCPVPCLPIVPKAVFLEEANTS
jgi:hypothetical protein